MTKSFAAKVGLAVLGLALGLTISAISAGPAYGYFYDRTGAVVYAKKYACNLASCSNPAYIELGADCTNFVSQAMYEGGHMPELIGGQHSSSSWFYAEFPSLLAPVYVGSDSWIRVHDFYQHIYDTGRLSSVLSPTMSSALSGALPGDVYMYDWGRGEGFSHLAFATGDGVFGSFFDPGEQKNYTWITGGSGSKMAQHSNNRDGAPWNWGYWAEGDFKIRAKMVTKVLRINANGF